MIEIRSLRRPADTPRTATQLYAAAEQDTPLSWRGPLLLAALLAAAVAYLKSLFGAAEAAAPAARGSEDVREAALETERLAEREPKPPAEEKDPADETGSIPEREEKVLGSGGPGPVVPGLGDFMGIDSPSFDYAQLDIPLPRLPRLPGALDENASNDNGSPRPVAPMAGTGGGTGRPAMPGGGDPSAGAPEFGFPTILAPSGPVLVTPQAQEEDDRDGGLPSTIPGASDPGTAAPHGPGPWTPDPEEPHRNRAPRLTGALRLADIGHCQATLLTLAMLLAGATDADGDILSVADLTVSHGTLETVDGGWLYTPKADFFGVVTLSYRVTDGAVAVVQSASFEVVDVLHIVGTPEDDILTGTECGDRIDGLEGDDVIHGRGGGDIISGGGGNDIIFAGAGDDIVHAGAGDDIVYGAAGNDLILGGGGHDELHGEAGNDAIYGEAGNDVIRGGDGDDLLDGGDGDDVVSGDAGDDLIRGGAGDDRLDGGDGDDVIEAGDGADIVEGGRGDDGIEGGAGADVVLAGGGDDVVEGGDGDDALYGEAGDDRLDGGAGNDHLDGGSGKDTLQGGDGDDTLVGGADEDLVCGGDGDDVVIVDADGADDVYDGGEGRDTLDLSELKSDAIVDMVKGELRSADSGRDKVADFEVVVGGEGDDSFVIASDKATTLSGGRGDDSFEFSLEGEDACEEAQEVIHRILDLEAGDRIVVRQYTLRSDNDDEDEDHEERDGFARIYSDDDDDADRPFRFRIEKIGEKETTFIDVSVEQERDRDFSIEITGSHRFYYYDC